LFAIGITGQVQVLPQGGWKFLPPSEKKNHTWKKAAAPSRPLAIQANHAHYTQGKQNNR
jgi:hypothetical protein